MASIIDIIIHLLHYPSIILNVTNVTILDIWLKTILQDQAKGFGNKKNHQEKNVDWLCTLERIKVSGMLIARDLDT